jgi:small subunit ribosomal protein S14
MKARERKRAKMVEKYAAKRAEAESRRRLGRLAKLPANSSKVRMHNRCQLTGRPRGYMRLFGISVTCSATWRLEGKIPGVTKGSW